MSVVVVILLAISVILAALAAWWTPPSPPRVNLLSLSVAFLALAFLVERWPGAG